MPPSLRAVVLAGMARDAAGPILAVVPGERDAEDLVDDLDLFIDSAVLLPAWGTLPFEHISPNVSTMAARCEARHRLTSGEPGLVVVASVRAAIQRVSPTRVAPIAIELGEEHDFDALLADLVVAGYVRTDRVEARGEFAVRGGILDIAPAQGTTPVRVEFWGDEVSEMRTFSTSTQRSTDHVVSFVAYPAREVVPDADIRAAAGELAVAEPWAAATWDRIVDGFLFPGVESWLPWLTGERSVFGEADGATIVVFDEAQAAARSDELVREEEDLAAALASTWGQGGCPRGPIRWPSTPT